MTYKDEYLKWLNSDVIDPEDKALLKNMENDENETVRGLRPSDCFSF